MSARDSNFVSGAVAPRRNGIADETGELYRLLVDSVEDYAIFALDADGHVVTWNAGAQRIKGYAPREIIGKHFSIFYPEQLVRDGFPDFELREAARLGRFEDEGWRLRKDGSRFWANVVITALRDFQGKLVGYAKVTRDLTDRRAADDALRSSEQRFRLLVQAVRDYAIFMLDPEGNVATWNEGAERINGYRADEIIGHHFSRFYPQEDIESGKPGQELERAEKTGRYEEEGWRLRKDGSRFWASVLITAIKDGDGCLIGFGKVTRDLTERQLAQQRALDDARRIAGEEAARHVADEANLAKSRFLAAMSHELRTPLNAIAGYVELLEMGLHGPVSPKQLEDLSRIKHGQQHLLRIISDILNYSRVEAGQAEFVFRTVPISDVFKSVALIIEPLAATKGLRLEVIDCPAKAVAWADQSRVEQILVNLLSNAVKFTDRGSVTMSCQSDGARPIAITVRDTGFGISPDQAERIFQPFVQVGRTLSGAREGTGLGLAISRDLARQMNGEIVVESTVGVGSTFTLTLPRSPQLGPKLERGQG